MVRCRRHWERAGLAHRRFRDRSAGSRLDRQEVKALAGRPAAPVKRPPTEAALLRKQHEGGQCHYEQ